MKTIKKILLFFILILANNVFSQINAEIYLGSNGIFKTLSPKNILTNKPISFDLKLTIQSTTIPSGKKSEAIVYLNTKDGFVGIDKSLDNSIFPNENNKNIELYIETMTKQSFKFSKIGSTKTSERLETNLINTYNNLPFKKVAETVAKSKKYLKNSITAEPFFIDKMGLQKKFVRYCYGINYPTTGVLKSYLGSYGVGFYNIDNNTFLCIATEHKFLNIEITKIEKVNFQFNTSSFKTIN